LFKAESNIEAFDASQCFEVIVNDRLMAR